MEGRASKMLSHWNSSDETVDACQQIIVDKRIDMRIMDIKEPISEILWQEINNRRPFKIPRLEKNRTIQTGLYKS